MARPQIPIKKKEFEKLCQYQCTEEEIASFFDCDIRTVDRWCYREYGQSFVKVFKQKRLGGRASLRRTQFLMAEKSATMAIFLGKQYLGQRDTQEVKVESGVLNDVLSQFKPQEEEQTTYESEDNVNESCED